jgi:1-acyl-sn-glycerol-3-phosphate acyltransferase
VAVNKVKTLSTLLTYKPYKLLVMFELFDKYLLTPFYWYGLKVVVRLLYRTKFIGFDKLPKTGPAIIVANHVSYMDGCVISAASPRVVRFVIDEDIYNVPAVKHFMSRIRAIPIAANKDGVKKALAEVSEGLKNGDLIMIFPEGQLTYTGNMGRFKFGVEWMLKNDPVPVYPMAIKGLWGSIFSRKYLKSKYPFLPRSFRRKVKLIVGDPLPPERAGINNLQKMVMRLKNSI